MDQRDNDRQLSHQSLWVKRRSTGELLYARPDRVNLGHAFGASNDQHTQITPLPGSTVSDEPGLCRSRLMQCPQVLTDLLGGRYSLSWSMANHLA